MIDLLLTTSDFDPSGLVDPQPQDAPEHWLDPKDEQTN
jgi:hypothetical protein